MDECFISIPLPAGRFCFGKTLIQFLADAGDEFAESSCYLAFFLAIQFKKCCHLLAWCYWVDGVSALYLLFLAAIAAKAQQNAAIMAVLGFPVDHSTIIITDAICPMLLLTPLLTIPIRYSIITGCTRYYGSFAGVILFPFCGKIRHLKPKGRNLKPLFILLFRMTFYCHA